MGHDAWSELTYFQSFDLVQHEFRSWHGRDLNAERTWEIVSCFVQGNEYYKSSLIAAEAVAPLIIYYSILSVCRGLVLFLKGDSESTLRQSHGLEQNGWAARFKSGSKNVLGLETTVSDGMFSALADSTNNFSILRMDRADGSLSYTASSWLLGLSDTKTIRLDDLIAREPSLRSMYIECSGQRPKNLPGRIFECKDGAELHFLNFPFGMMSENDIRQTFGLPNSHKFRFHNPDQTTPAPYLACSILKGNRSDDLASGPASEYLNDRQGFLIAPWPNGGYMTPLLRCFAEAYFLGMLVRYFPSRWMALISGKKGDAEFPLLRQLLQHLKDDFPKYARAELRHFRH